ncbi:unnamed protein product, partial [Rotaria socialis]
TMANPIFPKTIQLAIYGCGQPSSAVTKAQIESTITATLSPAVTSSALVPKTSGIVSQSTSGIIETVTPITPTTPIRTANVNTVTTTVNVVPTTAEIVNTGTKTTPMKTGSSAATGTTGPTTAARLPPTTVCKEIVDLTQLGSVLFASVSVNNLKFPTDGLEKKLSLSTLPTTVSIIFKHGVIINNVSVLNPSESRVISISAQTDLDFEPINNPNPAIPVVVYNPHVEDVRELDITILKIKDPSLPTKLQLAIYGCTTPSTISTKPLIETTSPQLVSTTQPSTRSGTVTKIIAAPTEKITPNLTVVTRKKTPSPITKHTTSITFSLFTGTTTKRCKEMQAVDEAVSKNIIVTPNPLPIGENIKFQPTSQQGVSFGEDDRTPTITVNFGKPAEVQSVTLPRDRTPNGNVAQFEVTFYSPHGHKINHKPILSSSSPNENKKKPAELDSSQIPSNTRVSRVVITIVSTTNGESPKGVVLDIQACTEATTELSTSHLSSTDLATKATDEVANETTTAASAALRCQTENILVEEFGIVDAEAIIETAKGETKVIGYIIRSNNTGWTPPSAFSSLSIGFRYPVQIGRILVTANNLKQWRLYYQSASEVFPYWIAYNNSMVLTNNEIIFSRTLNATKIRLTPNSDLENLRLAVFACVSFLTETTTTNRPCVLTEWSDWGACSRTCGIGYQIRTRKTNSSDICDDEQLIEHQSCMGRRCQCSIDEAFYKRVFHKEPSDNTEIGYIFTYSNSTNASKNIIYVNDTIDQGTVIRTKDYCYIVYCTAEGLKLSNNQCVTTTIMSSTTPITNNTQCAMQQFSNAPIKVNNGRCISRQSFPQEHCGGYCKSDSDYECKCCSIGTTYLQSVLFDCLVDGSKSVTEEKMIDVRRIQSCSCNECHDDCTIRQYESSPLRINSNRCVSRENVPRERCGGHCESDSDDQCTCCSITKTYLQPIIFDCLVNEAQNVTEQRTVEIRRIKECSCNICSNRSLNNGK